MEGVRRAVIDVGTNSVKLLVADVQALAVQPVLEQSKQTRLGRGFYQNHQLQPEAIAATASAVREFAAAARRCEAASTRVIATSAARDALNSDQLTGALEAAAGLKLEIISGEQEAEWAFRGVTTDPRFAQTPLLLLETGGGSTQFILGQGPHLLFRESFPVGTVRLIEKMPHSDPPTPDELAACRKWLRTFLQREVQPGLEPALQSQNNAAVQLVGTGGTATILARMEGQMDDFDRERIEAIRLDVDRVRWHMEALWGVSLADRKRIVGLPKNRADVILAGVAVYEAVMERFGFTLLNISTRGLRFAAVMADER